ncbi:COG5001 Predicted signal transduction protein containing a membrane domain, an EAL and a GGDEF domain [Comamonadaceae bacterium]
MRLRMSRASLSVVLATGTLIVAVLAVSTLLARNLYTSALADGRSQADRFVTGAQAAVNRSLLGVDVLLASLNNLLNLESMQADWLEGPLSGKLIQGATRQNLLVRNVWLLDAQGTVIASAESAGSETNPQTPPGFIPEAINLPVSTLIISQPVISARSSEQVLYFGRHLKLADGSKLLAVAEVPVNLVTTILVQGADISQLEATLERGNGQLLASMPAQEALTGVFLNPALGNNASLPAREMQSRIQQKPAIVASRPMLYNDLLITASIPMDTVIADWRFQVRLIALVAVAFCLFLAGAGFAAVRYLHSMGRAQRSISDAKATTDRALESMESGFLLLDVQRRVVTWNRRYLEMYPWQADQIKVGASFEALLMVTARETLGDVPEQARVQWVANRMSLMSQGVHSHEREFPNGRIIEITERPTPDGGVVIVYQDVTRLRRASAEIEQLAFFDPLTGLPNRRLLTDRLQQAVVATQRSGRHGALLFLDLDHFKTLNDTLGHDVGDLLLQQVAQRVKGCVREADTVARLGGDEFVVMLLDLSPDAAEAARQTRLVGDNVLRSINEPYTLKGKHYRSSCSLGAAMFSNELQSAAELLKQADIAMYQVKNTGRNALCFFDPGMLAIIEARANLENDLRRGISEGQFELHYQVQVTDAGTPVGAEALIRWHHPVRGLVFPGEFIALAEETGLILPMGQWVLEQACRQLVIWQATPATARLQLSVNVSARQFRQADFVEHVRTTLRASGAHAYLLKLELTESLVLDNVDDTIEKMHALKNLGVRFSMDDFGTGHSSLAYLTRLPLDQLKIDKSFVHNIGLQATDSMIIQTIIGMGNNLGLEVLGEGVETEAQCAFLAAHGCRLCQGYLFGRPQSVDNFNAALIKDEITA